MNARQQRLAAVRLRLAAAASARARTEHLRLQMMHERLLRLRDDGADPASLDCGWKLVSVMTARGRMARAVADVSHRIATAEQALRAAETAQARAQRMADRIDAAMRAAEAKAAVRRSEDWHGSCLEKGERQKADDDRDDDRD